MKKDEFDSRLSELEDKVSDFELYFKLIGITTICILYIIF